MRKFQTCTQGHRLERDGLAALQVNKHTENGESHVSQSREDNFKQAKGVINLGFLN